jgi:hypothetical protein
MAGSFLHATRYNGETSARLSLSDIPGWGKSKVLGAMHKVLTIAVVAGGTSFFGHEPSPMFCLKANPPISAITKTRFLPRAVSNWAALGKTPRKNSDCRFFRMR